VSSRTFWGALVVAALAGGAWLAYSTFGRSTEAPAPAPLSTADASLTGGHDLGISKGDPSAPLVIQEFADYQCPACASFAALTARALDEQYVKTGKVRWIFFDFPITQIHANALAAAQAARCAGEQGDYWGMHDLLFARQREWSPERNPVGRFREYARALRLDSGALADCIDSGRFRSVALQSRARGDALGVEATPTFLVGRQRISGVVPYDEFVRRIEEALAEVAAP
jgi:protein-disulfide isomerase